jgi:uncharacterized protein (DUF362 family)
MLAEDGFSGSHTEQAGGDDEMSKGDAVTRVAFVKTRDRLTGVRRALELLGAGPYPGKHLFVKPNYNTADPSPGSTHNDTLTALVRWLQAQGAERITLGDRSGMDNTRAVMERKGIFRLGEELGFDTLVLDELDAGAWERVQMPGSHWRRGFAVARPALDAGGIVQTCCLKTHRFGGHFSLSLKNSVGLVAKQVPGERYNYMWELHLSRHQRLMIAEINATCRSELIVLDGVEAFVDGGPNRGKRVDAGVILAGTDCVAVDAVGVALLRHLGTTRKVSKGPIFQLAQIARAVELGLGVQSPEQIELVCVDAESEAYAAQIRAILARG